VWCGVVWCGVVWCGGQGQQDTSLTSPYFTLSVKIPDGPIAFTFPAPTATNPLKMGVVSLKSSQYVYDLHNLLAKALRMPNITKKYRFASLGWIVLDCLSCLSGMDCTFWVVRIVRIA
jgi:hypothetical protein